MTSWRLRKGRWRCRGRWMRAYERLHATGPEFDGFPDQLTVLACVAHLREVPTSPSPPTGAISSVLFLKCADGSRRQAECVLGPVPAHRSTAWVLLLPHRHQPPPQAGGDEIADAGQLVDDPVQDFGSCPQNADV